MVAIRSRGVCKAVLVTFFLAVVALGVYFGISGTDGVNSTSGSSSGSSSSSVGQPSGAAGLSTVSALEVITSSSGASTQSRQPRRRDLKSFLQSKTAKHLRSKGVDLQAFDDAETDYSTFYTYEYIESPVEDSVAEINMFLCMIDGFNTDDSVLTNRLYVALVDMGVCDSSDGSYDTSEPSTPDLWNFVVKNHEPDETAVQNVYIWLTIPEMQGLEYRMDLAIREAPSENNRFGKATLSITCVFTEDSNTDSGYMTAAMFDDFLYVLELGQQFEDRLGAYSTLSGFGSETIIAVVDSEDGASEFYTSSSSSYSYGDFYYSYGDSSGETTDFDTVEDVANSSPGIDALRVVYGKTSNDLVYSTDGSSAECSSSTSYANIDIHQYAVFHADSGDRVNVLDSFSFDFVDSDGQRKWGYVSEWGVSWEGDWDGSESPDGHIIITPTAQEVQLTIIEGSLYHNWETVYPGDFSEVSDTTTLYCASNCLIPSPNSESCSVEVSTSPQVEYTFDTTDWTLLYNGNPVFTEQLSWGDCASPDIWLSTEPVYTSDGFDGFYYSFSEWAFTTIMTDIQTNALFQLDDPIAISYEHVLDNIPNGCGTEGIDETHELTINNWGLSAWYYNPSTWESGTLCIADGTTMTGHDGNSYVIKADYLSIEMESRPMSDCEAEFGTLSPLEVPPEDPVVFSAPRNADDAMPTLDCSIPFVLDGITQCSTLEDCEQLCIKDLQIS